MMHWSTTTPELMRREAAADAARVAVEQVAPEEMALFEERRRAFVQVTGSNHRPPILGSDLGLTFSSITDAAFAAAQGAVGLMVVLAAEEVRGQIVDRVSVLRRLWTRRTKIQGRHALVSTPGHSWTPEQLVRIRQAAVEAGTGRVNARTLDTLVDLIVARLVLADAAPDGTTETETETDADNDRV